MPPFDVSASSAAMLPLRCKHVKRAPRGPPAEAPLQPERYDEWRMDSREPGGELSAGAHGICRETNDNQAHRMAWNARRRGRVRRTVGRAGERGDEMERDCDEHRPRTTAQHLCAACRGSVHNDGARLCLRRCERDRPSSPAVPRSQEGRQKLQKTPRARGTDSAASANRARLLAAADRGQRHAAARSEPVGRSCPTVPGKSASQFRTPGPNPLTSDAYAKDLAEVEEIGALDSAIRTPEQTHIAVFWQTNPAATWNAVARRLADDPMRPLDVTDSALLFAMLDLTAADTQIKLLERQVLLGVLAAARGDHAGRHRRQSCDRGRSGLAAPVRPIARPCRRGRRTCPHHASVP
jgi:hypothetical protein